MSMQRVDNDTLVCIGYLADDFECCQVSVFGCLLYQDVFLEKIAEISFDISPE